MNKRPGILSLKGIIFFSGSAIFSITSDGTILAPTCWVIAPGSFNATVVPLILSNNVVLP